VGGETNELIVIVTVYRKGGRKEGEGVKKERVNRIDKSSVD
jgi:hypothetical protein